VGLGDIRIQFHASIRFVLNREITLLPERAFPTTKSGHQSTQFRQFMHAEFAHRRGGVGTRNGTQRARWIYAAAGFQM